MKAEILAVGTELLMGQIANTNAQYISSRLPEAGIGVFYHSVVGDNTARLKESLKLALSRSDIVITTGGLGPTQDDLTKETIAELMGKKLVLDEYSANEIKTFFEKINRKMVESNLKQAYMPEDSIIMRNEHGTAPGCIVEAVGKVVVMLPGPPIEMKPMFENSVMPYFLGKLEYRIVSRFVRVFGIGESEVENRLMELVEGQTNPTIATYAKDGEVTVRVTAKCNLNEDGEVYLEPVLDKIKEKLGNAVYSVEGKELEQVVGEMLMDRKMSISFAESCTGGLISAHITNIPGISEVFYGSIVSYSNEIKEGQLGVKSETLVKFGAVSSQTAAEMATGVRQRLGTDIGVSVTGIAGPGGGSEEKPIGLVYIGIADKDGVQTKELRLWGSRERIRKVTVLNAFDTIRKNLLKKG